jgi:hypothetical protein
MNNNNNNKILTKKLYFCFLINLNNQFKGKNNLNKIVDFQAGENFLKNLQNTCETNNINIGICIKNFNKLIYGNFQKIPLKKILHMCFDNNYYIEEVDNFIYIKEKELVTKLYEISSYLNKNQLNSIEIFLNQIVKTLGGEFIINKEDGCIFVKTLDKNHLLIKDYINKINKNLNKQIILECKIITIQKNNNNNKNLDLPSLGKKILDKNLLYEFNLDNFYGSFISFLGKNLLFFKDLDDVLKFLSKIYTTESIFNIKILMYNKQICEFKTEELRYANNHYDTKVMDGENSSLTDEDIKSKKIIKKSNYQKPYIIKNLKSFTSGVNLEITPHIGEKNIILNINFSKSHFNENKKNEDVPNIITNSFISSIKVNLNEITMLNGLKNNITKKIIKNKTPFKILNFFLSSEETVESTCEILFLIKVTKME